GATVEDLQLLDLDDAALGVLHGPRHDGVGGRRRRARRTDRRQAGGYARRRVHGERVVRNGRRLVQAGAVVVVGDPDLGVALQRTRVVRPVGRVRGGADRADRGRLAANVRDDRVDQDVL